MMPSVHGIAESEVLSGVEVSEARSSPNLAVILASLALLRYLSEVRSYARGRVV
jgi:hypothetical protein